MGNVIFGIKDLTRLIDFNLMPTDDAIYEFDGYEPIYEYTKDEKTGKNVPTDVIKGYKYYCYSEEGIFRRCVLTIKEEGKELRHPDVFFSKKDKEAGKVKTNKIINVKLIGLELELYSDFNKSWLGGVSFSAKDIVLVDNKKK